MISTSLASVPRRTLRAQTLTAIEDPTKTGEGGEGERDRERERERKSDDLLKPKVPCYEDALNMILDFDDQDAARLMSSHARFGMVNLEGTTSGTRPNFKQTHEQFPIWVSCFGLYSPCLVSWFPLKRQAKGYPAKERLAHLCERTHAISLSH